MNPDPDANLLLPLSPRQTTQRHVVLRDELFAHGAIVVFLLMLWTALVALAILGSVHENRARLDVLTVRVRALERAVPVEPEAPVEPEPR